MEAYQQLEEEFGKWAGVDNVVVCNSGTSALHLALESIPLPKMVNGKGAECILPDFTMIACARAVALAGLKPVFVDCCSSNLLMDPYLLEAAITPQTQAIMAVHVYGRPCPMNIIHDIANRRNLLVIEDMAEAHGLVPYPGTDAACWSFYKNKIIAGEEGGAVSFRENHDVETARSLRSLGFTPKHDFRHRPYGHNYRLANSLASLILDSLTRYDDHLHARRVLESEYNRLCPPTWRMPPRYCPWVYDLRIPNLTYGEQTKVIHALNDAGIAARHAFSPMSLQQEFYVQFCTVKQSIKASREVFYLPLDPKLPTTIPQRAFDVIKTCLRGHWPS